MSTGPGGADRGRSHGKAPRNRGRLLIVLVFVGILIVIFAYLLLVGGLKD